MNVWWSVWVKIKVFWMFFGKLFVWFVGCKWENLFYCLEIMLLFLEKLVLVMWLSDFFIEDDDLGYCKMNYYDKKIDSLMNVVGCLKFEVKM